MTGRRRCLNCHSQSHLDPKATRPPFFVLASAPAYEEHFICHISSSCVISSHLISSHLISSRFISSHLSSAHLSSSQLIPPSCSTGAAFSHLIPAQVLAPAMLAAFSKLSHLGAKLLLRTLGNSIFHQFLPFDFQVYPSLSLSRNFHIPAVLCSASHPFHAGSNLVCLTQI